MIQKEEETRIVAEEVDGGDIFKTEEIQVEEMAIDGICGVY